MMVSKGIEDIDFVIPKDAYDTGKDIPTFNAYLTVVVKDSEGRVIKVHRQRSHSSTANFIALMLPISYYVATGKSVTVTNIQGSSYSFSHNCSPSSASNCSGISYPNTAYNFASYISMIQVGNGSPSNPSSAVALASPIANGSGTGQLLYGALSVSSNITVSGSSAYFTISQTYNNESGGTITITEVGVITTIQLTAWGANSSTNLGQVLVWYDVLSSSISVPNGGTVTIYYTFTVNP
jgi:hypothetical protein